MDGILHINGRVLDREAPALWQLILDHTQCERSTAHIVRTVTDARRSGPVENCLVFPCDQFASDGDGRALSWSVRVSHPAPEPLASLTPSFGTGCPLAAAG